MDAFNAIKHGDWNSSLVRIERDSLRFSQMVFTSVVESNWWMTWHHCESNKSNKDRQLKDHNKNIVLCVKSRIIRIIIISCFSLMYSILVFNSKRSWRCWRSGQRKIHWNCWRTTKYTNSRTIRKEAHTENWSKTFSHFITRAFSDYRFDNNANHFKSL